MLSASGMYTMYLVEIGFTKSNIGIAVSIFTVATLLGQNFIGYLADRYKCTKRILLISITVGVAATAAMSLTTQVWFVFCMIFIWGFCLYGTVPLSDAWYIHYLRGKGKENQFGKIRGLGSSGYALSGVFIGFLLQKLGWGIYIFYILISASFIFLSIYLIKYNENAVIHESAGKSSPKSSEKISYREALSQIVVIKPLRSIIIILFMYYFVVKGIYSYLAVLLSDTGGGPLSLGVAYFFDAMPEIVTFFLAARILTRFKSESMIFASFILQIIRLFLILIFTSQLAIILLGVLSGFAYGLQAAAYKTYIYNIAPEKYKISCLSISESIISFSGVVSAPVFGFVIMKFGTYSTIAMGLLIDIAAALFIGFSIVKGRKNRQEDIEAYENHSNIKL
jgi:MFS family permease